MNGYTHRQLDEIDVALETIKPSTLSPQLDSLLRAYGAQQNTIQELAVLIRRLLPYAASPNKSSGKLVTEALDYLESKGLVRSAIIEEVEL